MDPDLRRYRATVCFKATGADSRLSNLLIRAGFHSVAELRRLPWEDRPHVRGLRRRLEALHGFGPVQLAQVRNVYDFGYVRERRSSPDR